MSTESRAKINRQREAILRFWSAMSGLDYKDVENEYLGVNTSQDWTNLLYQATEMAVRYMNEEELS